AYTVGDMALQRKEIIERLRNEGVFEMNRELQLPIVPQKIAVISSKTAAGYEDFINQLENNGHGFKFYTHLFEAYMQGAAAVPSIIQALENIFQYDDFFDAVAIIRGGGASADLNCFDNYELAFNISQFPLPVVTGIGHEKDDTIIDMIAHTRLKTPTAVAGFFINGVELFYDRLVQNESEIVRLTRESLDDNQQRLERMAVEINQMASSFIREKSDVLSKKGNRLHRNVNRFAFLKNSELNNLKHDLQSALSIWRVEKRNKLDQKRRVLKRVAGEIVLTQKNYIVHLKELTRHSSRRFLQTENERFHLNSETVRLLTPVNVLKRGYTLTLKNGQIVTSVNQLKIGDAIETQFADGKVKSKIKKNKL
ncbi:MAG TPA: exodeoxyribonuclease VII large subunit, partial [Prolixibacteraceae bacterium]|nr:exodeoxyribonuclease VII large subunit [Prolixibacteraceae bacterium]